MTRYLLIGWAIALAAVALVAPGCILALHVAATVAAA